MKIGLVSDTHNFLDPRLPNVFAGVEHILHAGDIGLPHITRELEKIAPVTAVRGNTDDPGLRYPLSAVRELAGRRFLLRHIVNPHAPGESLRGELEQVRPDVVVFGHSHKSFCDRIGRTLFVNPGYAGKARFGLPRSVGVLTCTKDDLRVQFVGL